MVKTNGNIVRRMIVVLGAMALICVAAPTVAAQSSSQRGYDGEAPLGQVNEIAPSEQGGSGDAAEGGQPVSAAVGDDGEGALPFTGMDLGIGLILGLALAGTGLVVRRAARSSGS
jgi:hypothetical protein